MPLVDLHQVVAAARAGQLVSFPTDTVPALAVRPDQGALIYAAKQRRLDKPLILMAATIEDLSPYVVGQAAEWVEWQQVMQRYWPGALTLVLPASDRVPVSINPEQTGTVGIRIPHHPIALQILAQTGVLATTSANLSGSETLMDLGAIADQFPNVQVLDPATIPTQPSPENSPTDRSGVPSTVAAWTETGWQILRSGLVTLETI